MKLTHISANVTHHYLCPRPVNIAVVIVTAPQLVYSWFIKQRNLKGSCLLTGLEQKILFWEDKARKTTSRRKITDVIEFSAISIILCDFLPFSKHRMCKLRDALLSEEAIQVAVQSISQSKAFWHIDVKLHGADIFHLICFSKDIASLCLLRNNSNNSKQVLIIQSVYTAGRLAVCLCR